MCHAIWFEQVLTSKKKKRNRPQITGCQCSVYFHHRKCSSPEVHSTVIKVCNAEQNVLFYHYYDKVWILSSLLNVLYQSTLLYPRALYPETSSRAMASNETVKNGIMYKIYKGDVFLSHDIVVDDLGSAWDWSFIKTQSVLILGI